MKYIPADKLIAEIERLKKRAEHNEEISLTDGERSYWSGESGSLELLASFITPLQQEQDMGEVSDGYHTFNELYYYRMLYNAAFFNLLPKGWVHKSKRHHTGEECFDGDWFIVIANLPTGQVSNHYKLKDWDLFKVPEKEFADKWDGHTPQEAAERIHKYLQQEQPKLPGYDNALLEVKSKVDELYEEASIGLSEYDSGLYNGIAETCMKLRGFIKARMDSEEQPEVDLEKEVDEWRDKNFDKHQDFIHSGENATRKSQIELACYFYELGLNARKEE